MQNLHIVQVKNVQMLKIYKDMSFVLISINILLRHTDYLTDQ